MGCIIHFKGNILIHFLKFYSHIVGGVLGATTGLFLSIRSYINLSTRCTMALILPRYDIYDFKLSNYQILSRYLWSLNDFFFNSISTKSLATKRGRSFLISTAIVLLVKDGPINTLEQNVQQVAQSITCMYEQVRWSTLQEVSLCILM